MKITINTTNEFLLTFRNKDNSKFYIRPKNDHIKEIESNDPNFVCISAMLEGIKTESEIIQMMKNNNSKFYTYNKINNTYTEVIYDKNNELKSICNETKIDNIANLSLLKI